MNEGALLIHAVQWSSEKNEIALPGGITLCRTEGSTVERLYYHLCETIKIDDGDPLGYHVHFIFDDTMHAHGLSWPDWGGSQSLVSQFCNFIVMGIATPPGACRIILSKDNFNSCWATTEAYEHTPDRDYLEGNPDELKVSGGNIRIGGGKWNGLTDAVIENIGKCWSNYLASVKINEFYSQRVKRALDYFFYAWRAFYIDQTCLNLAIVLETLFSPPSGTELSHQIAYFVSRFYGVNANQRKETFDLIRDFYRCRSIIVHGAEPKYPDTPVLTARVFKLCCYLLERILINEKLFLQFNDNKERKKLFEDYLFQ